MGTEDNPSNPGRGLWCHVFRHRCGGGVHNLRQYVRVPASPGWVPGTAHVCGRDC